MQASYSAPCLYHYDPKDWHTSHAPLWVIGVGILLYNLVFLPDSHAGTGLPENPIGCLSPFGLRANDCGLAGDHFAGPVYRRDRKPADLLLCLSRGDCLQCSFHRRPALHSPFMAICLFHHCSHLGIFLHPAALPHHCLAESYRIYIYQDPLYVASIWFFFSSTLIVLTYLASGRSERLRQREAEVLGLSESLEHVFAPSCKP